MFASGRDAAQRAVFPPEPLEERAAGPPGVFNLSSPPGRDHPLLQQSESLLARLPIIWGCVTHLMGRVSSMPVRVVRPDGSPARRVPAWVARPNPHLSMSDLVQQGVFSLLQHGNWYPLEFDGQVYCPDPRVVSIDTSGPDVEYRVNGMEWPGRFVHVRFVSVPGAASGLGAIDAVRGIAAISRAAQDLATRHFERGLLLQYAVSSKDVLEPSVKKDIVDGLIARHSGPDRAWRPMVLDGGLTIESLAMTAEQGQFIQLAQWSDAVICSQIYRLDPSLLGIVQAGAQLTYSNQQDRERNAWLDAVQPLTQRIEAGLSALLGPGLAVDLDERRSLYGNTRDRVQAAVAMSSAGILTMNEIRELVGYPPVAGGDELSRPAPAGGSVAGRAHENVGSANGQQ